MMSLEQQAIAVLYLLIATFLGALIGNERERKRNASAGLRTHMLVCIGACVFTILSIYAFPGGDSSRVAAQIVSGVGFLGAGVIIQGNKRVHNLTTAASIWATAAVGMAVGSGAWLFAMGATIIIWVVLAMLRRFEGRHL